MEGYAYNVAVLPNDDGTLYVYLYPAQAKLSVYPVGGDTRYTISADGTKVLETHRMHKNVLFARTASPIGPNGGRLVANVFKEVLADVPQDTGRLPRARARAAPAQRYYRQGQRYSSTSTVRSRTRVRPAHRFSLGAPRAVQPPRAYALKLLAWLYAERARRPII